MKQSKPGIWDPYLIRLTIKEKLLLISVTPIVALLVFTALFIQADIDATYASQEQSLVGKTRDQAALFAHLDSDNRDRLVASLQNGQILKQGDPSLVPPGQLVTRNGLQHYSAEIVPGLYLQYSHPRSNAEGVIAEHRVLLVAIFAVVLLTLYVSYTVRCFITGSLHFMQEIMGKAVNNDLTVRMNFHPGRDDLRPLAHHIDALIATRQTVVRDLRVVSEKMQSASRSLENQASTSKELAVDQRLHLDTLASAMEEMTATVREVANHAEQTSVETRQASKDAESGHSQIQTTIATIEQLVSEVHSASSAVSQVNTNADRIDAVVTTINGISEQTNLLALNAAIEAARAGHQGRGFAVVADEVRSLAGRTQAATVEIQKMIEELQGGTRNLETLMGRTVERAEQGQTLVSRAGQDLMQIAQHSDKVFAMSSQIATAAEQQSSVANEIAGNLMQIRNQSHELEQSAVESVQASQSVLTTANGMQQQLMGLKI
ncbi:methyl-accepting chemotaxis protein [Ferrimonas balearica]|uniref:methyl-accepting chemotaxis protein n=1 Tax=Ferrimonas balearica TaxID=44012 RepID=UPI001C9A1A03|nr:methyl-accepting chemotaxis protein [Ferrimonas balearica]MBY5920616.1 methyl-accepting chemotaxis protein [Ferrimonas balearica]MBY5996699.1 methyl-accepting chemotaxis protein [Ferrimonas balearica]